MSRGLTHGWVINEFLEEFVQLRGLYLIYLNELIKRFN